MKTNLLILTTALAAVAAPALAKPETYALDPSHTGIVWKVNHFGFSNPSGKFGSVEGRLVLDEENMAASSAEVVVKTASVLSGVTALDAELTGPNFFNSQKFPAATFKSTKVEAKDKENFTVTGDLTLLGITKPLTLNVHVNKIGTHPFTKKKTIGLSANGVIKRSEYGMIYGVGDVSDEVMLDIETEASVAKDTGPLITPSDKGISSASPKK